ncbi:signal peptidase IB [Abditibacteriota bacterium]|nr:signal peptidase IB [Abditibacteriota bacterium]
MKTKHWILVSVVAIFAIGSTGFSVWFKANAQAFYMPSGSMAPTLPIGARVIGWMHAYDSVAPQHNDIALLKLPLSLVSPGTGGSTTTFVKRVIGLPGDRVEMKRGVLTLNGKVQSEPFIAPPPKTGPNYVYDLKVLGGKVYSRDVGYTWTREGILVSPGEEKQLNSTPTQAIPADKFLVLGDNRGNSNDSHVFGLIPRSSFEGKVGSQFWPRVRSF